jgi:hypothetical protein
MVISINEINRSSDADLANLGPRDPAYCFTRGFPFITAVTVLGKYRLVDE